MNNEMAYMTVNVEWINNTVNLSAWLCTVDFYEIEKAKYGYVYEYIGYRSWIIRSNAQLTPNMIIALGEGADKEFTGTTQRNMKRKLANR